jgi:PAS domain-containing protein
MRRGLGAILTCRDLTPHTERERDLRRLASMAEESPIAIVELNEAGNMIYANATMLGLIERFGFASDARPAVIPANIERRVAECLHSESEAEGIGVGLGVNFFEWKLVPVAGEKFVRAYGIDLTARKSVDRIGARPRLRWQAGPSPSFCQRELQPHPCLQHSGIAQLIR